MKYFGKYDEMHIISIIAYLCKVNGAMNPGHEIEEMMWADSSNDVKIHGLTKNKIIAELVDKGLIN